MDREREPAEAGAAAKQTAALLRDARSVQRRLDTLAAAALAIDDATLPLVAEARVAIGQLVVALSRRQVSEQRRARTPGRRLR